MDKKISRRDFLKIAGLSAGASAALAVYPSLAGPLADPASNASPDFPEGAQRAHLATTCGLCPAGI